VKAIIMAGGEGKRLRPLTCNRPKPMVFAANKPVMTHTIELLKKHGFYDIGVTLQYMASHIMDQYGDGQKHGVKLHYFIEDTPLGTAGSVKNAQDFLDETFLVISGDALTDIDLTEALKFHRQKKSLATLILTSVDNPLKYGIVITKKTGEIVRFLEKPSWGEVFSDKVNTGIYILEPEVLDYIPPKAFFDFSKNLFPLLMEKGITLYGYTGKGYWCDIGNPGVYFNAHQDILTNRVSIDLSYDEIKPGIWIDKNTEIHPTARLEPPLIIGRNCYIGPHVFVGAHSIIGNNCIIEDRSSIKKSILWNGVMLGKSSALRGAIVCSNVKTKNNVSIFEGAIVGDESMLEEGCTIKPQVKIWPGKTIEEGSTLTKDVVWGIKPSRNLFGNDGVKGIFNKDITLDLALRLGSAFGSVIEPVGRIGVGCDNSPVSGIIKKLLVSGLQVSGHQVCDLGNTTLPITRFSIKTDNLQGGIHVKTEKGDMTHITFLNENGANISKSEEKRIENILEIEDFRYIPGKNIKNIISLSDKETSYFLNLRRQINQSISLKVVLNCPSNPLTKKVKKLLEETGCNVEETEHLDNIKSQVCNLKADVGIYLDSQGEKLVLFDEKGNSLKGDKLKVLLTYLLLEDPSETSTIVAPIDSPSILEKLARKHRRKILYTKSNLQARMENMINQGKSGKTQFALEFDGIQAMLKVLKTMNSKKKKLSQLIAEIPPFYLHKEALECPWEIKGKIIRTLVEKFDYYEHSNSIEGVKFKHPEGWTLIIPDSEKPRVNIISEGSSSEMAEELTSFYKDVIQEIIKV